MADEIFETDAGKFRLPEAVGEGFYAEDVWVRVVGGNRVQLDFVSKDTDRTGYPDLKGEVKARVWMSLEYFLGVADQWIIVSQIIRRKMEKGK